MLPKIVFSIGDIHGIGPEVILKSLHEHDFSSSTPVVISPKAVLDFYAEKSGLRFDFQPCISIDQASDTAINVYWDEDFDDDIRPGELIAASGKIAMKSIEKCIHFTNEGTAHAMVTAPISKEAVNLGGYSIPGHTEFLAEKTGVEEVLMMLVNEGLRIALVTAHVPISEVASSISLELILKKAQLLHHSLKFDFGIPEPNIAVLGLNPHAGDGGVIGMEEINIIEPAIRHAKEIGINLSSPFPADGFFGHQLHTQFDAILAMYHDQGLAPFKLLSFGKGVNFTAGLPIIRTSPDHGTAFNIAGLNKANPSSFKQAIHLAEQLVYQRYGL